MPGGEDYAELLAELRRHIGQPVPGILLVEFTTLPQLEALIAEWRALDPARTTLDLPYDPPREDAVRYLARIRAALGTPPAATLPLLILRPRQLPDAAADHPAAVDFWRALNFRRESLTALPAQLLLCVDRWHHERLTDYAADLRDQTAPKFHLFPPATLSPAPAEGLSALSAFEEFQISPEAAESRWQTSWPALEKMRAERPLQPGDLRRFILPLLEATLSQGNLVRARQVRDAAQGIVPAEEDQVEWHRLNAMLACAAQDFTTAEDHADKLLQLAAPHHGDAVRQKALDALWNCTTILADFGQARLSERFGRELCSLAEELRGPEHRDSLALRRNLAGTLLDRGKAAEAEAEHRQRLAIEERVLGVEHPDTLASRNNLANALHAQGKYGEAEQENRARVAIEERVLGAEHPDTLSSRNSLANALHVQDKYAEAEQEYRAVLAVIERVLGAEHPHTLAARNNLANALHAQGKHAEAEQEHRALIAIRERVLGKEHPDVFRSYFNLALCLRDLGKTEEALELAERAKEGWKRTIGEEHPDYILSVRLWQKLKDAQGE